MSDSTSPIRVHAIDHVSIIVKDLDVSRAFYRDLLGMTEVPRPGFRFGGAWLQAGETQVHLITHFEQAADAGYPNERPNTMKGVVHHFAFRVDDADAAAVHLKENGVRINGGPTARPDGRRQMWFYDPDGHVVEVFS